MEIKVEKMKDSLKITKSCKKELRCAFIIGIICNICIAYPILKITPGEFYFPFLFFYSPIFLIIEGIFCHRFIYEIILIEEGYIYLLQSFVKPDIFNAKKNSSKNILEIFAKNFDGSVLLMSHNIFKERKSIKNHPNYRVHFYFRNENEEYYGWGYEIPIEKANEVVNEIKEFLKEHNQVNFKENYNNK